jgi:hypothetical protein
MDYATERVVALARLRLGCAVDLAEIAAFEGLIAFIAAQHPRIQVRRQIMMP